MSDTFYLVMAAIVLLPGASLGIVAMWVLFDTWRAKREWHLWRKQAWRERLVLKRRKQLRLVKSPKR